MTPALDPVHLVLVAGGTGTRMNSAIPKQFLEIRPGWMILEETLSRLLSSVRFVSVVVVVPESYIRTSVETVTRIVPEGTDLSVTAGGHCRQESCAIGVFSISGAPRDLVMIHDAARPFVSAQLMDRLLRAGRTVGAAIPVIPSRDSLVTAHDGLVLEYLDRSCINQVQTPQVFRLESIRFAHQEARNSECTNACDDATLVNRIGYPVATVDGDPGNLKVTTPEDLDHARHRLNAD